MIDKPTRGLGMAAPLAVVVFGISSVNVQAQEPTSLFTAYDKVDSQLLDWKAVQHVDTTITGTRFVKVNRAALSSMKTAPIGEKRQFSMDLFGTTEKVELWRHGKQLNYTIIRGTIVGGAGDGSDGETVVIAYGDEATAAVVEYDDNRYVLQYTGVAEVHGLHQHDMYGNHAALGHAPCGTDEKQLAQAAPPEPGPAIESAPDASGNFTIDVATFYTPLARQQHGGVSAIESTIAARIGTANTGSNQSGPTNGGTGHNYRLTHTGETNYSETGSSTDVNRFRNTNEGFMDEVHAIRNQVGADLMALITGGGAGFCGIAYSIMCTESVGFRVNAFSVTLRTCFGQHTFTHELGHTQGCAHDRANAGCGCFSYSYGGRWPNNQNRSIMSYSPGTRRNYWSNSLYNGQILGGPNDDNTRTHQNASDTVSQFKPATFGVDPPVLSGLSANSQVAYLATPINHTITGTDLDSVTTVTIGSGTANIVSQTPTSLTFSVGNHTLPIGSHSLTATNFGGTSNALTFSILGNDPPVLEAPVFHTTGNTMDYDVHTELGAVSHLFVSGTKTGVVLPGVVTMGLGAPFFLVASIPADNTGLAALPLNIPVGAVPPLSTLHWEAIKTIGAPAAPLTTTNVISTLYF